MVKFKKILTVGAAWARAGPWANNGVAWAAWAWTIGVAWPWARIGAAWAIGAACAIGAAWASPVW